MKLFRKKQPEVRLVNVGATSLRADNSLFVTIDPQFADMLVELRDALVDLVGHQRVEVLPLPKGAVQFFQAEHPFVLSIDESFRAPIIREDDNEPV